MKKAPDFYLPDQNGKMHKLNDYAGKWLVLYFYPKDNTPGCTQEACSFRDARELIVSNGRADIIGISKDTTVSHKKFANKNNLNFTLLSDKSLAVIKAYEAWGPKRFMGKEFLGILRNTYIISPNGNIVKEYIGVNPQNHVVNILSDLKALQKN